jgi:predicted PurR-regulated permease PerM
MAASPPDTRDGQLFGDDPMAASETRPPSRTQRLVLRWGVISWRLIGIGIVAVACLWLLMRIRAVVIPLFVAVLLARALAPISEWLRRRRWRPGLAAAAAMLVFFLAIVALATAITPALADEADSLGPTITAALDEIEDWLVDDAPFDISRETVDNLRERIGQRVDRLLEENDGSVLEGAALAAEIIAGLILALLLTFFILRDGSRFETWVIGHARPDHQQRLHRAAASGWSALGAYLRGAALLGVVEAIVIGLTLLLVGGRLVVPVMLLTFVAAFVPIFGAIAAGVVATLVALVTAGTVPAVIVAVVALVVQQLDNDVLAPFVYGRSLQLHPVVILLSVVTGGALLGLAGAIVAVPLVAVAVSVGNELRADQAASSSIVVEE